MTNDATKKLLTSYPDDGRNIGQLKIRWLGGVDQDAKPLRIKNWETNAMDGDRWRNLLDALDDHATILLFRILIGT